jgi:hypothetical protein
LIDFNYQNMRLIQIVETTPSACAGIAQLGQRRWV